MAQLTKIRYADGRVVRPGDWTVTPLYSSVDIAATPALADIDAFSYGKGGDVPGSGATPRTATLADTNMEGAGSILAENEELLIYGLSIELLQRAALDTDDFFTGQESWCPDPPLVSATNAQRVQRDTMVRMKIANTKDYSFEPLGFFPAARGVDHVLGAARSEGTLYTESVAIGQNGNVSEGDHRRFATPQEVGPGEAFEVRFEFPYGTVTGLNFGADDTARITARIFQRGLRRRPVA